MRKPFIQVALLAVLAVVLTACNFGSSQNAATPTPTPPKAQSGESPAALTPTPTPDAPASPLDLHTNPNYQSLQRCTVTKPVDGDTLYTDCDATRIRLVGVDTPETVSPSKPVQCFGAEASAYTKTLVGKVVYLESDASQGDTDRYGRPLRFLYLEDGTSWNMKQILEGYGNYDGKYSKSAYMPKYQAAAQDAKANQRGLWSPSTCNGDATQPAR